MQYIKLGATAMAVVMVTGCAGMGQQKADPIRQRVYDLDRRVVSIENKVQNQNQVDLMTQVQQLEEEVRQLRGQLETQKYEMDRNLGQQRDLYKEMNRRLSQASAAASQPVRTVVQQPTIVTSVPVTSSSNSVGDEAFYRASFDKLKNGQYEGAISSFSEFKTRYPQSGFSANAQYWLGEAYYVTRDFAAAQNEFQGVLDRFPTSGKVPDAMLKLGYVLYEQDQWEAAKSILNDVAQRYGNSSVASLAQQRLDRIKAEGH